MKNHAVDESTVDEIFHQSQAFFALLPRVKDTVRCLRFTTKQSKDASIKLMGRWTYPNRTGISEGTWRSSLRTTIRRPTKAGLAECRTNKGEVHEAFNLGLDPSLDPKLEEDEATEGELKHSENLWPSEEVWKGADAFVSHRGGCRADWGSEMRLFNTSESPTQGWWFCRG